MHLDGFGFQVNRNKSFLHKDKKTKEKGEIDDSDSVELKSAVKIRYCKEGAGVWVELLFHTHEGWISRTRLDLQYPPKKPHIELSACHLSTKKGEIGNPWVSYGLLVSQSCSISKFYVQ